MHEGDIVLNRCVEGHQHQKYQVVTGLYRGTGVRTIDYMGNTNMFDKGVEHLQIVGHMQEYDVFIKALGRLLEYKDDFYLQEGA